MRKLLLVLFLVAAASYGFQLLPVVNRPLVFNQDVNQQSVNRLWRDIRYLNANIPKNEVITIYLNSNGGSSQPLTVMLERINKLKRKGRKFTGVVYGYCYSACGSLFTTMDKRYMTRNAVYLQHLSSVDCPTDEDLAVGKSVDNFRLKSDAAMLGVNVRNLQWDFRGGGYFIGDAKYLLSLGMIDGIVEQPDIDDI